MIPDVIRKHAIWLYGVLVGLALKEAITLVLPHLFDPPDGIRGNHLEELWRLLIFVVLAVRFYFGATVYFDEAYERCTYVPEGSPPDTVPVNEYETKSFGSDFLFGFFHFVLFCALSLTIENHTSAFGKHDLFRELSFLGLLSLILIYDLFWLGMNWSNSTFHLIKRWAFLNFMTVALMGLVLVSVWFIYYWMGIGFSLHFAEAFVLIPVLLASAVDIIELIMGKPIVAETLMSTGDKIRSLANKSPTRPNSNPEILNIGQSSLPLPESKEDSDIKKHERQG